MTAPNISQCHYSPVNKWLINYNTLSISDRFLEKSVWDHWHTARTYFTV